MTALGIQRCLALIFLLLGSWCLFWPLTVESLVFKPEFYTGNSVSQLLMACFGAQAVLAGIVILTSTFTAKTFVIFGLFGSIPFFVFNYYFYFVVEMFTDWMLLDFVGNIGILTTCIIGYRLKIQEQSLNSNTSAH